MDQPVDTRFIGGVKCVGLDVFDDIFFHGWDECGDIVEGILILV